ncbi:MAG TPA: hypothetical protein VEQ59_21865, partial [Polyangiaceae bacterium]|nr:hypothetical protein [Polyangiaceae bacterium]
MSGPNEPKQPRSASSDEESDALLDSLLFEELPVPAPAPPPAPAASPGLLQQPPRREFSEDDVTVVGRTEDLFAKLAREEDDGTSGLEDIAGSDIDELLSSMPAGPAEPETGPPPELAIPRLPDVPPAPRVPVMSAVPRPGSRLPAIALPRPALETTAKPPAVNPAGLPARQPYLPATSPKAPPTAPSVRQSQSELLPLRAAPVEEEERTRVFTQQDALELESSELEMLADPFLEPEPVRADPRSSMPTLHQLEDQNSMPTVSAPQPASPAAMPTIPGPQNLPSSVDRDADFDLFAESPLPLSADAIDQLEEVKLSDASELRPLSDVDDLQPPSEPPFTSVRPSFQPSSIPAPASLTPSIWPDERPAQDHLGAEREAWVTRAEWLENEARATSDAHAKVRTLIVASEIWALVGELPRAREVAAAAGAIPRAQAMAARQQRALAAAEGDYKAVAPALEMEIRSAATVDARVHAAYLSAEVHRLALHDDASAKKKLDLAVRAQQDDPRA